MCYLMSRSRSFVAALAIVALSAAALRAQAPQTTSPSGGATAQGPANVNVVNVPTVTIGNTALQPIPVKESAREPVYLNYTIQIVQPYSISSIVAYAIPAGKRFTIEHVSMLCASDTLQEAYGVVLADGAALTYLPTQTLQAEGNTVSRAIGAMPLAAHVDGGSVRMYAGRGTSNGTSNCFVTLAGYLTALQ